MTLRHQLLPFALALGACASPEAGEPRPSAIALRHEIAAAIEAGDFAVAERAAVRAETWYPADPVLALLAAEAHLRHGDREAALGSLARAAAPGAPAEVRAHALFNRATLWMEAGAPDKARADLEEAWQLGLRDVEVSRCLGAAAYAAGDFPAAARFWSRLPAEEQAAVDRVVGPGFFVNLQSPAVARADAEGGN